MEPISQPIQQPPLEPNKPVADEPTINTVPNTQQPITTTQPQSTIDESTVTNTVATATVSEDVAGIPAAGRFDLSSVYPTVAEQHPPVTVQPAAQQDSARPTAASSAQPQMAQSTAAPTSFAIYQQSDALRSAESAELVNVPMKNIFVVGLIGPFATIGMYAALYMLLMFMIIKIFSGSGIESGGSALIQFIGNPGVQAAVLAGFLYLNIRITATYYEDLKIPNPSLTALFSVMLVFSTVAIGIKNISSDGYYGLLTGLGGSYFFVLLSLFSGLLWYPLSVKWGLSPVESTMKKVYPYVAGVIILFGVGLYLIALFNSSARQL